LFWRFVRKNFNAKTKGWRGGGSFDVSRKSGGVGGSGAWGGAIAGARGPGDNVSWWFLPACRQAGLPIFFAIKENRREE